MVFGRHPCYGNRICRSGFKLGGNALIQRLSIPPYLTGQCPFSFYKGDTLIQSYDTARIIAEGGFSHNSDLHNNEGNGYVHFYADEASELFDRIVISEANGGGFESDNHSFHVGDEGFDGFDPAKVPEPAMRLGLVGIAGMLVSKRKQAA